MDVPTAQAAQAAQATPRLYDMHCHLDFLPDPHTLAREAARAGIGGLSVTVTPRGYEAARTALAGIDGLRVGLGAHPWWVGDGRVSPDDLALFEELASAGEAPFVGEVGLDFGPRHVDSAPAQLTAFERIAVACAAAPDGHVLSLHAVRAADATLDVLERTGCVRSCRCVFHWFSCSSDELHRAVRAGCLFSINPRMLDTRRGRAYVQAIPRNRLLLETDEPPEASAALDVPAWRTELAATLARLEEIRREPEGLAEQIARTSEELLGTRAPEPAPEATPGPDRPATPEQPAGPARPADPGQPSDPARPADSPAPAPRAQPTGPTPTTPDLPERPCP